MYQNKHKIILVGCGKMGFSLVNGWLDGGVDKKHIHIIEVNSQATKMLETSGIKHYNSADQIHNNDNDEWLIVFAVKPDNIAEILPHYTRFVKPHNIFMSVIAGKKIDFFEQYLGKQISMVRLMPNLAVSIKQGVTALYANNNLKENQKIAAEELFSMVGTTLWLEGEEQMDAVTAISGSGPAYLFLLADCLITSATQLGLPQDIANKLVKNMLSGSGNLMLKAVETPAELVKCVASPNGTTAAALNVLQADDIMQNLMNRATKAAKLRSIELTI